MCESQDYKKGDFQVKVYLFESGNTKTSFRMEYSRFFENPTSALIPPCSSTFLQRWNPRSFFDIREPSCSWLHSLQPAIERITSHLQIGKLSTRPNLLSILCSCLIIYSLHSKFVSFYLKLIFLLACHCYWCSVIDIEIFYIEMCTRSIDQRS